MTASPSLLHTLITGGSAVSRAACVTFLLLLFYWKAEEFFSDKTTSLVSYGPSQRLPNVSVCQARGRASDPDPAGDPLWPANGSLPDYLAAWVPPMRAVVTDITVAGEDGDGTRLPLDGDRRSPVILLPGRLMSEIVCFPVDDGAQVASERLEVRGRRLPGFLGPWLVVHFVPLLHSHLAYADVKQKSTELVKVFWLPERVRSVALTVTWHELRYLDRARRPCAPTDGHRHCLEKARLRAAAAAAGCLPHFMTAPGPAEEALPNCRSPESYRQFVTRFQRPVTGACPRACRQLIPAISQLTTRDPNGLQVLAARQADWLATLYLDTVEMMVVEERPITTGADLVADVGGMLGLLLGYSVFTLITQLEAALHALVRRVAAKKRWLRGSLGRRAMAAHPGLQRRPSSAPPPQPASADTAVSAASSAAPPLDISTVFTTVTPRPSRHSVKAATAGRKRRRVRSALGPKPLRPQDTQQELLTADWNWGRPPVGYHRSLKQGR